MDDKRKRRYDTLPDIYMNGRSESRFFRPHYPVEDSEREAVAISEEDCTQEITAEYTSMFGNMQG